MSHRYTKIKRDQRLLFSRNTRSMSRMYFIGLLTGLIIIIPIVTLWQFDDLQLAALKAVNMAPTATPFASDRAKQAEALFLAGDIEGSAVFWEQAAKQQPDNVTYLYEYGMVLVLLGRESQAIPLADQALAIAPNDPRGYALKATALMWSDPAAAIPIAINGVELDDNFAPLHSALAVAYTNINRYQEAIEEGAKAVSYDPTDANARRAFHYPLLYTGRYDDAISQLERAIAINPYIDAAYFELASLYRAVDEEEMALGIFQRLIELTPNNAKAYLRMCETYIERGYFQEGEPYCDEALAIDPNYGSAYAALGQLQYTRRNYEGAIESFQQCVAMGEDDVRCYYLRGWAHYFLAQCDAAWNTLNDALPLADTAQSLEAVQLGLGAVQTNCAGYNNVALPTEVPPTPIPPTPIGGI